MKIIFTNGVFDILHVGHIRLLQWAKSKGNFLIVGINSDTSVKRLKGKERPINQQSDRQLVINAIKYVNLSIIFDEDTPYELIKKIEPDIIVKGDDYKKEDVIGNDLAEIFLFPHTGHSTTKIIKRLK
jgi:D-beta-D-heptose 7-phosphate kinase/D-beta-D-heptose 1-phosphate adenosyltransferase